MSEIKKSTEPKDYKERFEFELTVGNNIICQRYFCNNNFNPTSLRSYELTNAIRSCVDVIDRDLKDKTHAYLELYAPKVFDTVEEMERFISNPANTDRFVLGEGLVVRGNSKTDYVYTKDGVARELGYKFDDGELTEAPLSENKSTYKFAFKVDGREVCAMVWDGYYPKFVRDKIDLSNKRGKFDESEVGKLSFEQYLRYKMVQGKSDLVYGLIKRICQASSFDESRTSYTVNPSDIIDGWNETSMKTLWGIN